jgi:serine/threonine protein kinase/Flp pilus assembly protein TadD
MVGKTISHYRILEKLGEGGMSVVYKAMDTKLKRTVALKFLAGKLLGDEEDRARFIREAQAASALNHPNICTIFEIDESEGKQFIAMEFVEGQTLKSEIVSTLLELDEAIQIAIQIAGGLRDAHERGIVHCDIKPANIMLTAKRQAKIMDFGVARLPGKVTLDELATTGGTIAYMSPEQVRGEQLDHRTDIWSLGLILFELMSGQLPFKADFEQAIVYSILNKEPEWRVLGHKIPGQMISLMETMLEKDRTQRCQTMEEVITNLELVRTEMEKGNRAQQIKAIVVLPFKNISSGEESDYFCDGLTEELNANLSRLHDVRVVSRTSSMQYKGTSKDARTIGKELGVRYIIEGSVRKFQDDLRITAQLTDVKSDSQLWAETYKGRLADVFDIQEQVSRQIVDALTVKLTPTEKVVLTKRSTLSPKAFDYNLRAREFLYRQNKTSLQFAIQLFQKAIELDPRYAAAYAGLGETYAYMYQHYERQEAWLERAIESSLKALMYDSTLSEAHAALGLAYFNKKLFEEAESSAHKAIEFDSNSFIGYWTLGRIYHATDRDIEAADLLEKALELNPDFFTAQSDLMLVYEQLGDQKKRAETLQSVLQFFPQYLLRQPDDARARMFYAIHLVRAERYEEAKIEAAKAIELNPNDALMMYNASCFYSRLGEIDRAVKTFKNAIAAGFGNFEWIKRDPDLDNIREDPEYIELMKDK